MERCEHGADARVRLVAVFPRRGQVWGHAALTAIGAWTPGIGSLRVDGTRLTGELGAPSLFWLVGVARRRACSGGAEEVEVGAAS